MLARLLKPSFSDFIFLAILGWMFVFTPEGFSSLLEDGDTGWHIRAGQWILEHGTVPTQDLFSYSKPGETWFAWEWGTDVLYALLYNAAGLKAISLFAAVQIALFAAMLGRMTLSRGASLGPAMLASFLAVGACTIHYFARPHLATLLLVPVFAWILDRDAARRGKDRLLWLLVPLTALWTNLHGGFLAGVAMVGIYCVGSVMETLWNRPAGAADWRSLDWAQPKRLALVGVACGLATLANPYGYHLHTHVMSYVSSSWIQNAVVEFRSPSFRGEHVRQYEVLLLAGLMAAALRISRRSVSPALLLLFWAHQSLTSVRHLTIYSTVAAPWVAVEATLLWRMLVERSSRKSTVKVLDQLANDSLANFRHTSLWPATAVLVLAFVPLAAVKWPADFPARRFPTKMIAKHDERIRSAQRLLTEDQWADYLIYRNYPRQRVYFDGRSDFYGEKLGTEYTGLMTGRYDWRQILDKREFDVALIPLEWSLASLLKHDPDWRVLDDDGKALLFERVKLPESRIAERR